MFLIITSKWTPVVFNAVRFKNWNRNIFNKARPQDTFHVINTQKGLIEVMIRWRKYSFVNSKNASYNNLSFTSSLGGGRATFDFSLSTRICRFFDIDDPGDRYFCGVL